MKKRKGYLKKSIAFMLLAGTLFTSACSGAPSPYEENDKNGYTVSVRYDAGEGLFGPQTRVVTDTYKLDMLNADEQGNVKIALLSPDDPRRNTKVDATESEFIGKADHYVKGWYKTRTEVGTDENGNPLYEYSDPWDFKEDVLTLKKSNEYSSTIPVLTLYADYAPAPTVRFYDINLPQSKPIELKFSPEDDLPVPYWDTETGTVVMGKFKALKDKKGNFTFNGMYYDKDKTTPVTDSLVFKYGDDGTVPDMDLYVDWLEGSWFKINNATQLSKNASASGKYIITTDLDFEGKIWPSAFINGEFTGTITTENGQLFTFKNISASLNMNKTASGLFGTLGENAKISNISFENATVTIPGIRNNGSYFGLFSGKINDGAVFENVSVTNSTLYIGGHISSTDYAIGFISGMGTADISTENLNCDFKGENADGLEIVIDGDSITLVK